MDKRFYVVDAMLDCVVGDFKYIADAFAYAELSDDYFVVNEEDARSVDADYFNW